ncbi:MAG TPA: hypothetical protein PKV27_03325, partial [Ilumatobacteraceae bacterium]|nr:hypothetical protein [Ilumatobacteraceae bacterium]
MSTSIEDRLAAAGHELDRRIAARVARTASGPASIAASPMGGGSRRTWSLIAIGAVAATAVVVGTVLLTRDGNRSITPATSTITATTNPLPSSTTSPSTSPSTLPSTSVPPASVPSTSSAPTTPPAPPVHRTVQLADVMRDGVAQRTVLYTADVGAGVNQLGREDCQECEPTTPWTPVLLPDGTLVIADMNNSRWVVVRDGAPAAHPFPDGRVPIAQPVADDDGTVYSVDGYYQA